MGLFNRRKEESKNTTIINGYEIDIETGMLIHCPKGLNKYVIPKEVRGILPSAKVDMRQSAEEIEFEVNAIGMSNISVIHNQEFEFFQKLKRIVLPEGIKELGNAFDPKIVEFNLPSTLEKTSIVPMINDIIIIPNSIKQFTGGIYHNTNINYIEIPGTIEHLHSDTVRQCKFLNTLILKEGIKTMDMSAISGVNNLVNIEIPNSLKDFFLGNDDFRPMKGTNGAKDYVANPEKEQQRTIHIKKTINNMQYNFEIIRNDFSSLSVNDDKLVFNKNVELKRFEFDITTLNPNKIYVIDIQNRKVMEKDINNNQTQSQQYNQPKEVNNFDSGYNYKIKKSNEKIESYNSSISQLITKQTEIRNSNISASEKEIKLLEIDIEIEKLENKIEYEKSNIEYFKMKETEYIAFIRQKSGQISQSEAIMITSKSKMAYGVLEFENDIQQEQEYIEILRNEIKLIHKKAELGFLTWEEANSMFRKKFASIDGYERDIKRLVQEREDWQNENIPILKNEFEKAENDLKASQIINKMANGEIDVNGIPINDSLSNNNQRRNLGFSNFELFGFICLLSSLLGFFVLLLLSFIEK